MTETASGSAAQGSSKPAKGLTVRRIYTRDGIHPYDEVSWERRDVVMTNWRDGSVNFEQHGVEFPEFWSVNAGNIVTTKYFRGAVGTPQREWSLKQLVDRAAAGDLRAGKLILDLYSGTESRAEAKSSQTADFTDAALAAHESGARKLLFLGSSCIYPKHAPQPIPESALLTGPLVGIVVHLAALRMVRQTGPAPLPPAP